MTTSGRTLIRGGCVLTLGAKTPNYPRADVLIEDGRIAQVGPDLRARDAEQVDASDTIVMPGFVDTHRHAWKTLFRNLGDERRFETEVAPHHEPEDVYAGTFLGLLTAASCGTTTVVDWADVPEGEAFVEAALQAHVDAGVRGVFVDVSSLQDAAAASTRADRLRALTGTATTLAAGAPDAVVGDPDAVGSAIRTARKLGLRVHLHVAGAQGAIARLGEQGLLGDDITVARCVGVGDGDLDAIAAADAAVSLTPSAEMATGAGAPPLQQLIDRGVRPGLGVDDELLAPGDMFAQMRALQSLQHATLFDRKLSGKGGVPNLLSTRDVIRYATTDGARVAGLADVTGALEPGKAADVILLRTDTPNIAPVNDPIGAVVWGMDPSNIDWVFVAGAALVRSGELLADTRRARELALASRDRVNAAAGGSVTTRAPGAP